MDIQNLLEFDRDLLLSLNGCNSLTFDNLMMTLTSGVTWIPLYLSLLFLIIKNNENIRQIFLIITCSVLCIALSDIVADLVAKPYFERWRPSNDPILKYTVNVVNNIRGGDYGFFSAHASNTFSIAIFFCLLVRSKLLSCSMILWSLINCYTRIYLGLHYPGDILVGLLWGALVGSAVYYLYYRIERRISSKAQYVSTQYTSSGYDHNDVDICIAVLCLTLVYAIIRSTIIFQ